VEYGNDLDVQSHGSGFPTAANTPSDSPHASFVASPWNLNNLPLSDGSLLSYISPDGEISGVSHVSAPWVYVGMLFASFCWHNEDNYLYSINYHHFGGGKTWYGVPGPSAHDFEKVFHEEVPELFEADPKLLFKLCTMITPKADSKLLFKLCTMITPKVLKARGIPVVHTIQRAGEFIITFPQANAPLAYHAGFSHGFNCNEAVNFALADWLPYGRASIERYKDKKRSPVFSHERLVCTIAHRNFQGRAHEWITPWVEKEMRWVCTIAHRNFRGGAHERITPWVEKEMRWVAATERAHREALITTAEAAGRVRGKRVADGDTCDALMTTAEPAGRVRGYRVADGDNHVRSETEWIGGVAESDLPQCHRCLHYLYLSAVLDMRNPKRISCLEGACVSALVGTASEGGEMALGEHAQHLVLAYRFSMLEIYALIASSEAGELARARQIDTHFPALEQQSPALQARQIDTHFPALEQQSPALQVPTPERIRAGAVRIDTPFPALEQQSPALKVWFQRSEGAGTKGAKQKAAGSMRKGGQHASGRRAGARISQASAAGTKRPGQSSAAVPGKLYFGFCDEVIKAIKRLGGDAASDAGADKSTGGGGGAAGGGGLCKVEWDQTAGRPRVPVKVGHACSIEEVGEVQVRPAWVDEETGMYYPKGFRSTRVFPSMVLEGKCSYISSVEEGEAGQPVFCVECADEVGVRITAGSPADCWQQVMLRAAKRLKPT
ncbi:JmjC domain, hydroxylase-domain-containing protein, partial [Baffinella frigidus]